MQWFSKISKLENQPENNYKLRDPNSWIRFNLIYNKTSFVNVYFFQNVFAHFQYFLY